MKEYIAPYYNEDGTFKEGEEWREELATKLYIGTDEEGPDMLWYEDFAILAEQNSWVTSQGNFTVKGWTEAKI